MTLRPIARDRLVFWRLPSRPGDQREQRDGARERRGNQLYVKLTSQVNNAHRLSASMQYDKTRAKNALIRSSAIGASSASGGLSSATPQQVATSGFGDLVTGGPLFGVNYSWVVKSNQLFQFIGSWMVNNRKRRTVRILRRQQSDPDQPRQHIAQPDNVRAGRQLRRRRHSDRSCCISTVLQLRGERWARTISRRARCIRSAQRNQPRHSPLEFYFGAGDTGNADILFERQTFRTNGSGAQVATRPAQHLRGYFQDRWKPRRNLSIRPASDRLEPDLHPGSREGAWTAAAGSARHCR